MEKVISRLKQYRILQLFTISLRYLLGSSFVYASIFKIRGIRFTPKSGESAPIDTLPHFLEAMYQATIYWHFIGWGQLIAGFLLMSQVFSTLGAVVFFPIMLNIFVITISFDSTNILIITFLMLLATIYLLLWDWNNLKFIVLPKAHSYVDNNDAFLKHKIWAYLAVFFFFIIILMRVF
ncbi:MAG: DoxX family membrane protein [Cyclobacteriaceae bacterium]